ncbi:PAS domain S-box protein [candidate division KSB1 bacterium]|nr:PAS domain S-box protein [candidate division KSB1 bacterium]
MLEKLLIYWNFYLKSLIQGQAITNFNLVRVSFGIFLWAGLFIIALIHWRRNRRLNELYLLVGFLFGSVRQISIFIKFSLDNLNIISANVGEYFSSLNQMLLSFAYVSFSIAAVYFFKERKRNFQILESVFFGVVLLVFSIDFTFRYFQLNSDQFSWLQEFSTHGVVILIFLFALITVRRQQNGWAKFFIIIVLLLFLTSELNLLIIHTYFKGIRGEFLLFANFLRLSGLFGFFYLFQRQEFEERTQSISALAKSEERFRQLVETTSDWIWEVNEDFIYTYSSAKVKEILGYEPAAVLGKTPFDFMLPAKAEVLKVQIKNYISCQQSFVNIENTNCHQLGHEVILESSGVPIFANNGRLIGFRGINREVTVRKRAEVLFLKAHDELEKRVQDRTAQLLSSNRQLQREIAERIEVENRLAFFRRFVEESGEGIGWTDLEGHIKYANPTLSQILGINNPVDVMGTSMSEYYPEQIKEELLAVIIPSVLKTGGWSGELSILSRGGKVVPIMGNIFVLRDETGQPNYFAHVLTDLTEVKKTAEEFQKQRLFFNSILENLPNMVFVKEADNLCFEFMNKTGEELLGLKREHLIGKNDYDFFPKDQADFFVQKDRGVLETGKLLDIPEEPINTQSGLKFLHTKKIPLRNDSGTSQYLLGISEDITEKKQKDEELKRYRLHLEELVNERTVALKEINQNLEQEINERKRIEEALRQSSEMLLSVIDNIPQYICWKDRNSVFLGCNRNYAQKVGLVAPQEIFGKTEWDFPGKKHEIESFLTNDRQVMESNQPHLRIIESREEVIGSPTWFETNKIPLHDAAGKVTGVLVTFDDITARIENEERIKNLNEELEKRVIERTAQLEAAYEELKNFAYIVSHDLKAPLRGISQLAHWLVEDYSAIMDNEGKELIGLLTGRIKRMNNLIEGILRYLKVGRLSGKGESIELEKLLLEVIEMLAPPSHIKIILSSQLPIIQGEKIYIEQIFLNLLSNAIKFMDKPQGEINIEYLNEPDFWKFCVRDNGPGIEPQYHRKIFEIFQTLEPRDKTESTGIGLSIVKKIVELYGGRIWVESKAGQGSCFYFTLLKRNGRGGSAP